MPVAIDSKSVCKGKTITWSWKAVVDDEFTVPLTIPEGTASSMNLVIPGPAGTAGQKYKLQVSATLDGEVFTTGKLQSYDALPQEFNIMPN